MVRDALAVVEAVVHVGAAETRYLRHGRGPGAVVLAAGAADRLRLVRELAVTHCAIAPVLPSDHATSAEECDAFCGWLCGVIDGLGLQRPVLVIAGDLSGLAAPLLAALPDSFAEVRVCMEPSPD